MVIICLNIQNFQECYQSTNQSKELLSFPPARENINCYLLYKKKKNSKMLDINYINK
jgi:hypothetical protein